MIKGPQLAAAFSSQPMSTISCAAQFPVGRIARYLKKGKVNCTSNCLTYLMPEALAYNKSFLKFVVKQPPCLSTPLMTRSMQAVLELVHPCTSQQVPARWKPISLFVLLALVLKAMNACGEALNWPDVMHHACFILTML